MRADELIGLELDFQVSKAEGVPTYVVNGNLFTSNGFGYSPSTDPTLAMNIITRNEIQLTTIVGITQGWMACCYYRDGWSSCSGPNPMVAAMRAYVMSRLGMSIYNDVR